jgi:hypothetical protein
MPRYKRVAFIERLLDVSVQYIPSNGSSKKDGLFDRGNAV